jgi:hypothetical protein
VFEKKREEEEKQKGDKGMVTRNSSVSLIQTLSLFSFFLFLFFYCSYLVDPASSHMLVSKIKPCMSKYKQLYTVKLRMAH